MSVRLLNSSSMTNCDKNIIYVDTLVTAATLYNSLATATGTITMEWHSPRMTPTMICIRSRTVLLIVVVAGGTTAATGRARRVMMHTVIGTRCLEIFTSLHHA